MNDRRSRPRRWTQSAAAVQPPASASSGATAGVTSRLRRPRQLVVDDLFELLEGLRARDHATVDEERRRARHSDARRVGHVLVDVGLELLLLEALVELGLIEPDLTRELLQRGVAQVGGREQLVVELPELPLGSSARGGLRGGSCGGVELERKVAVHEADLVAVRVEHLLHGRLRTLAERTLVVGELDDRDRRRLGAARRPPRRRDLDLRRLECDAGLVLALELGEERFLALGALLLLQELDD